MPTAIFFSLYFWLVFANFRRVHFLLKLHAIEHFVLVNCACCMRRMRYMCEQSPCMHCTYAQLCRKTQNSLAQQANILPVPGTGTVTNPAPLPSFLMHQMLEFFVYMFFFEPTKMLAIFHVVVVVLEKIVPFVCKLRVAFHAHINVVFLF